MARILGKWSQLSLLLRRNFLLFSRDMRSLIMATLLPLLILLFLISLKQSAIVKNIPAVRMFPALEMDPFTVTTLSTGGVFLYAPRSNVTSYVERIMNELRTDIDTQGRISHREPHLSKSLVIGFDNEDEIERYYQESVIPKNNLKPVFAAIIFPKLDSQLPSDSSSEHSSTFIPHLNQTALPCIVSYTIRYNGSYVPSTEPSADFVSPQQMLKNQLQQGGLTSDDTGGSDADNDAELMSSRSGASVSTTQYLNSGFLAVQSRINRAILDIRTRELMESMGQPQQPDASSSSGVNNLYALASSYKFYFQSFPSAAFSYDSFHEILVQIGPIYMILGYLPLLQKIVIQLVTEKEKRIKEHMKISGVLDSVYFMSWYLAYTALSCFSILLTLLVMSIQQPPFFTYTSMSVIGGLLFLFVQALIMYSLLISTFFSKAKIAGQFASTSIFLLFLPIYLLPSNASGFSSSPLATTAGATPTASASPSRFEWVALLSPPIAFSRGFQSIADAESAHINLNVLTGALTPSLKLAFIFLVIDVLLLAFAAYYLESVIQNEYGHAKKWNFLCTCKSEDDDEERQVVMDEMYDDRPPPRGGSHRYTPAARIIGPDGDELDEQDQKQHSTIISQEADDGEGESIEMSQITRSGSKRSSRYNQVPVSNSSSSSNPNPFAASRTHIEAIPFSPRPSDPSIANASAALGPMIQPGIELHDVRKTFDSRSTVSKWWGSIRSYFSPNRDQSDRQINSEGLLNEKKITHALKGLSLHIARGEILSLLGANGSGKSTSISILSGLIRAGTGAVYFEGMKNNNSGDDFPAAGGSSAYNKKHRLKLNERNLSEIRQHLFCCPQSEIFFDNLTVEEHLAFYAALKGVPRESMQMHIREKLNELGMLEKEKEYVKDLSGGMRRKLCVLIALMGVDNVSDASCRDVIFLDEPSSSVDPLSRLAIWQMLRRYKSNRVIVLTTHSMIEAEELGDRIAILNNGKLKCVGTKHFLKQAYGIGYKLEIAIWKHMQQPVNPSLATASSSTALANDSMDLDTRIIELTELVQRFIKGARRLPNKWTSASPPARQHGHVDHINAAVDASSVNANDLSPPSQSRSQLRKFSTSSAEHELEVDLDDIDSPSLNRSRSTSSAAASSSSPSSPNESIELNFMLPLESQDSFAQLFHCLESEETRDNFGIVPNAGVQISVNSLEEIFFKVIEEAEEDEIQNISNLNSPSSSGASSSSPITEISSIDMSKDIKGDNDEVELDDDVLDEHDEEETLQGGGILGDSEAEAGFERRPPLPPSDQAPSFARIFRATLSKKIALNLRDKKALLFLIFFPVFYVAFGLLVSLKGVDTTIFHRAATVQFSSSDLVNQAVQLQSNPDSGIVDETTYDRIFRDNHQFVPAMLHSDADSQQSWFEGLLNPNRTQSEAKSDKVPLVSPGAIVLHTKNDSYDDTTPVYDLDYSTELDGLISYISDEPVSISSQQPDDNFYTYSAFYAIPPRPSSNYYTPNWTVDAGPTGSKPLPLFSHFRILINGSATHIAPVMINSVFSSLFDRMERESGLYVIDSQSQVSNVSWSNAAKSTEPTCPYRAINAATKPFIYTSSSLGLQVANFMLGFLLVISLSYLPIHFGVQIIKHEKNDTGSTFTSGHAASNQKNNSSLSSTNFFMQKCYGGAGFVWKYWLATGAVDLMVCLIPLCLIGLLFIVSHNSLLAGAGIIAKVLFFVLWGTAMIYYTYGWTYVFSNTENMQLVLSLLYGIGSLLLFVFILSFKFALAAMASAQAADPTGNNGSGGRSKTDTNGANPLASMSANDMTSLVQTASATTVGMVVLIGFVPSVSLPWTIFQLAWASIIRKKNDAACALETNSRGDGESDNTVPATNPDGSPLVSHCVSSSIFDMLSFDRVGGVICGLLLSILLSWLFIMWKEQYVKKWWRMYVKDAPNNNGMMYSLSPAPQFAPVSQPDQPSQAPSSAANDNDVELAGLVSQQEALAASAQRAASGQGEEPEDVAQERLRVSRSFDRAGIPMAASPPDPVSILSLRKKFPLKEPLIFPNSVQQLSPQALAQLQQQGIDPSFAPAASGGMPTIVREKVAIDNLSFGIPKGETFGLLGLNGSGKSSTVNVLLSALAPDSGSAFIRGVSTTEAASNKSFDRVSHCLAFVPQGAGLFDALTPMEHLYLYGRIKGLSDRVIERRARRFFKSLQMEEHAHAVCENLSGGTKRKVLLCIAMLSSTKVLLLDEVSAGVDVASRRSMWMMLRGGTNSSAASASRCTLLTTHSMEEAQSLCSRLGMLVNGSLKCIGTARELKAAHGGGLELHIRLNIKAHVSSSSSSSAENDRTSQEIDTISPEFMNVFLPFIRALITRARSAQPLDCQHPHDELKENEASSSTVASKWKLPPLEPLPGFPFDSMPSAAPSSAGLSLFESALLAKESNNRSLSFILPSPPAASNLTSSSSRPHHLGALSLSLFFAYMQRYRACYAISDYTLNQATLDQVFLKFAREQQDPDAF